MCSKPKHRTALLMLHACALRPGGGGHEQSTFSQAKVVLRRTHMSLGFNHVNPGHATSSMPIMEPYNKRPLPSRYGSTSSPSPTAGLNGTTFSSPVSSPGATLASRSSSSTGASPSIKYGGGGLNLRDLPSPALASTSPPLSQGKY